MANDEELNQPTSSSAAKIVTFAELNKSYGHVSRVQLPPLRMFCREKDIMLSKSLEHDFSNSSKSERADLCNQIVNTMIAHADVHQKFNEKPSTVMS